MSKHTPGPWGQDKWGSLQTEGGQDVLLRGITTISAGSDERIAEAEANTRLIAAAPELLSIAKRWAALDGSAWHPVRYEEEKRELLAATNEAISKATA
ncbi:hypothetical protein [Pseudomonas aeruginosa]|uniref:hypothetical protein n=1 Tax=Pseudomonas aeruginosa TaxID=287 RepID=UPI000B9C17B1|nr:hypothetical protein [Pseudomonas aeruginosa]MBG4420113.1 hypothetical protein [Pseudomonas aeruginosa]OXT86550.1 hypothetical protein CF340_13440 [Pseudomonas aeruginosa]